jgi:hypothetical protein
MKKEFRQEIQAFEDLHMCKVGKGDFAGVFGRAFIRAFDADTVQAAFRATGVYPFNPDIIPDKAMKPSLPTSIRGSFPLPQTSPVRAIIKVMGSHPPTAFDLSPTHNPQLATEPSHTISETPLVTGHRRTHSPPINPEIESPSKRLRTLHSALGSTSLGSLLLSKPRPASAYMIPNPVLEAVPELPQPDWSLLYAKQSVEYQSCESLKQENK